MAPAMAPASGRARNRASGDLRPTRSSDLGGGQVVLTGPSFVDASNVDQVAKYAAVGNR